MYKFDSFVVIAMQVWKYLYLVDGVLIIYFGFVVRLYVNICSIKNNVAHMVY